MSSSSHHQAMSRHRNASMSSAGRKERPAADYRDFSTNAVTKYFEPCDATASMFLYGQGNSVVVAHHDSLTIERRFSRHSAEVQLLAVDAFSEIGAGRLVVSYDVDMTAIVWDLMTGDEVARFASYDTLTCASWMRNGNVAFGNTQGNIILFEPTTSEHISARTIDQIAVTALAPAADCRTFAIGYQNGSCLVATLQPRFTILHNLSTSRSPSPIVTLSWHASSSRQKADMLAVQTQDGDLRVWSVPKTYNASDPAKVVRILKRTDNYQIGANWMGWSKNGRIIQFSENETLSWDVRTKHVTFDSIPTLEHVRGLAVYGPGATLFTLGGNNTVQQFDLNTPSLMVANVQHPANLLPPSPPVSIEEQNEQGVVMIAADTESLSSIPINSEVSESDEDHLSPFARIARGADVEDDSTSEYDNMRYRHAPPSASSRSRTSIVSGSSTASGTEGRGYPRSVRSRAITENTHISAGSSMRSSAMPPYGDKDAYSISSISSASITSSTQSSRHRPSRLRNEVSSSPDTPRVNDLFKFTRSRLHDIPYKHTPLANQSRLTNGDLRRQMLSVIFGWNREVEDLVRDEMSRHENGSPSRILLAKWLGDIHSDVMTATSENMTSSDWMLLALSGIGGQASQHKLGRAYVQRLLENGDVHAAATIMIGMGDHNDAIEIYVSHKRYLEALILLCMFFPNVWERQAQIIKKWGEFAVQHGQQQLAIRCFACCGAESTEPWASPSATQVTFQSLNGPIPEVASPPLSPPGLNRGPQRSIAKSSSLKLITTFGDQGSKSKFFSGDDGKTPLAAGATPIAESAIYDPGTAFIKPSQRSAMNTPATATQTGPIGFGRDRLPSIGEAPGDVNPRELLTVVELPTPPVDQVPEMVQTGRSGAIHSRKSSGDEQYSSGLNLARAQTASPMMMREIHRRKEAPPPSPSPQSLQALMKQGRSSRNGARDRMPEGMDLTISSYDAEGAADVTSPEPSATTSVASSARYHWPKRRGPSSVTGSVTSNSTTGRSYRSHATTRTLDDYIHSLDTASQSSRKPRARDSSRHRQDARSRETSRSRKVIARELSADRGREIGRSFTPQQGKRSPTSPVPMSPEELINLSTPKLRDDLGDQDGFVAAIDLNEAPPSTVRKSSQIRTTKISSRASSRAGRGRSPDHRPPPLDLRGRSESRGEGSFARSPSSPVPMSSSAVNFYGSDDDEDYRAALEDQERFRAKHNKSAALNPTSPAVHKARDRSTSRPRRAKTPGALEGDSFPPVQLARRSSKSSRAGDLKSIRDERQQKKDGARELEDRRQSLARRPSAPPIPHPDTSTPRDDFELPSTVFVPPRDIPARSQTADPMKASSRGMRGGPTIGLPATPKAMRLKFDSESNPRPSVPPIPVSYKTSPPSSGRPSPEKQQADEGAQASEPPSLLTLLPSTVYSPPARPNIPRSMSCPPEEAMQSSRNGRSSRKGSVADASQGPPPSMRGIDQLLEASRLSRRISRDGQIPPPPPPPPVLKELQHLATPPPPPPAPLPGSRYGGAKPAGTIEIVMDDADQNDVPAAAPMGESVVPIISPPAPPQSRGGHARGRSITDNSITGRISRAAERMRSASRGANSSSALAHRTKSPDTHSPYESIPPPPVSFTGPQMTANQVIERATSAIHGLERHPREVRAAYQAQELGTGLNASEMI